MQNPTQYHFSLDFLYNQRFTQVWNGHKCAANQRPEQSERHLKPSSITLGYTCHSSHLGLLFPNASQELIKSAKNPYNNTPVNSGNTVRKRDKRALLHRQHKPSGAPPQISALAWAGPTSLTRLHRQFSFAGTNMAHQMTHSLQQRRLSVNLLGAENKRAAMAGKRLIIYHSQTQTTMATFYASKVTFFFHFCLVRCLHICAGIFYRLQECNESGCAFLRNCFGVVNCQGFLCQLTTNFCPRCVKLGESARVHYLNYSAKYHHRILQSVVTGIDTSSL